MTAHRRLSATAAAITAVLLLSGCAPTKDATSADSPSAADQPPPAVTGSVWVANEDGDSLTVIDAGSGRVVTTVTGIGGPHNVQAAPDGSSVWAVSGHDNAVVSIDPATYRLLGSAPTGKSPAHVVLTPDGDRAYVTNSADDTLSFYDTAAVTLRGTLPTAKGPHGLRPASDGKSLVVANTTAGSIDVVDIASGRATTIPVGSSPAQVALDDAGHVYVSLMGDRAVAKVDLRNRRIVATVTVPSAPVQLYLTSKGQLLSANQGTEAAPGRTLSVINPATMTITTTIPTGSGPHGVVTDPTGTRAWVTNIYEDTLSVLDLNTGKTLTTVPVGDKPNGVSYSARDATPTTPTVEVTLPNTAATEGAAGHNDHH